jgi:hypothetical protein
VVDVASGRAVGVNGIDITECDVSGGRIQLTMTSPFAWVRRPVVVFRRAAAARQYRIVVNGADVGAYGEKSLATGILVPAPGAGKDDGAAAR